MSLKDHLSEFATTYLRSDNVPKEVDEDMRDRIQENIGTGSLLRVVPYENNDGVDAGEQLLKALHDLRLKWGVFNKSGTETFEIWFHEGEVQFIFYVDDERNELRLRRQLNAYYPNAKIVEMDERFPPIRTNDYVAGAELNTKRSSYIPIRQHSGGARPFKSDPYKSILSDMVASDHCRTMVQIQFKPAHPEWAHGGPVKKRIPLIEYTPWYNDIDRAAERVTRPRWMSGFFTTKERSPTSDANQLASEIMNQEGLPAYHVVIRALSFGPHRSEVKSNIWSLSKTFEKSFEEKASGQTFVQTPKNGWHLNEFIEEFAARDWVNRNNILTISEVASLAHLPGSDVVTPEIKWSSMKTDSGKPTGAETFREGSLEEYSASEFTFRDTEMTPNTSSDSDLVSVPSPSSLSSRIRRFIGYIKSINEPNYIADPETTNVSPDNPDREGSIDTDDGARVDAPEPDDVNMDDDARDRNEADEGHSRKDIQPDITFGETASDDGDDDVDSDTDTTQEGDDEPEWPKELSDLDTVTSLPNDDGGSWVDWPDADDTENANEETDEGETDSEDSGEEGDSLESSEPSSDVRQGADSETEE